MIGFRNTTQNLLTVGATSTTIPIPAGVVADDLLIAWVELGNLVTSFVNPPGWQQFSWSPVVDAGNSNAFVFWKFAVNGETAPAISWTTSSKGVIVVDAYSGVDKANPFGANNVNIETASQATATTPSLAATANQWAKTIHSSRTSTSANKTPTWTAPGGETQRNSQNNGAAAAAPWSAVVSYDSNGVVTVASHSYTATSSATESHHKSALIYLNNVTPQLTDTVTLAESVTDNVALPRAVTDAVTVAETLTRQVALVRGPTETVGVAEALTAHVALVRGASDAVSIGDVVARTVAIGRTVTDAAAISDTAARAVTLPRAAADTATVADSPTGQVALVRAAGDTVTVDDTPTRITAFARALADAITIADTASATVHNLPPPADILWFVDDVPARWQPTEQPAVWQVAEAPALWQMEAGPVRTIATISTEYVHAKIGPVLINGAAYDPTGDVVAMAFMAGTTKPGVSDWKTGSWEDSGVADVFFARCLIGPGQVVLAAGDYTMWVKITDNPEIPARQFGLLRVY